MLRALAKIAFNLASQPPKCQIVWLYGMMPNFALTFQLPKTHNVLYCISKHDVYTFEKYMGCMQSLRLMWNVVQCVVAYRKLWLLGAPCSRTRNTLDGHPEVKE